jgi:hypothetical protein
MTLADKPENSADSDEEVDTSSGQNTELQEGVDYYLEDGLFVFTAIFLRKRGYCCESGCRHCPYGNDHNF